MLDPLFGPEGVIHLTRVASPQIKINCLENFSIKMKISFEERDASNMCYISQERFHSSSSQG